MKESSIVRLMLFAVILLAAPRPALAEDVPAKGAWSIDYGEKYCSLVRAPGVPGKPSLVVRMIPGFDAPEVLLIGSSWRSGLGSVSVPVEVEIGAGGSHAQLEAVPMEADRSDIRGIGLKGFPSSFLSDFGGAASIRVHRGNRLLAEVQTPNAKAAVAALNACNDKLLAYWGVDMKAKAALTADAVPVTWPGNWFGPNDYPESAVRSGTSGTVVVRYTVGTDGRIKDCAAVGSSGDRGLDAATCEAFQRAGRYRPAIGPDGKPDTTTEVQTVNWAVSPGQSVDALP